jgi:two-component system, cell cycle sensor histidine kinase and response regulator CckA
MNKNGRGRSARLLRALGLHHVAHRPPLTWRFWIYSVTAYLLPIVVLVALPSDGSTLDEVVWLVTLVPAFLLSLHFGLRGAFVALVVGVLLLVGVELFQAMVRTPGDLRITVPIFMAYGALAISVGWLSEQLHEHYGYALESQAAQKTEALGTMTAGIAHDFNNILTAMVANAELMAGALDPADEEVREELGQLRRTARRGAGMVRNLLGFSRRGMLSLRAVDLSQVVEGQRDTMRRLAPEPVGVELESEEGLPAVLADREAVERMLAGIVTNARDAMPFGGRLQIRVERCRLDREHWRRKGWGDPGEYVCLSVADTGTGMDEATLARIFEPFFTGKEPGQGVGLGMAMVYGLMKQHRGFVDVSSEPGHGTTVRLFFPVAKDRVPAPPPERVVEPTGGSETILLVEDDDAIRHAAQRILERAGYTVLVARDGDEAVEMYREHRREVDLVLADVVLPKRSGPDVYRAIHAGSGDPRILFMSGYPANTLRDRTDLDPHLPFLQKPWTVSELTRAVREALDVSAAVPVGDE